MKTIKVLFVICLISLLSGCNRLLDLQPVGQQTLNITFSDFAGAQAAVNGLYGTITASDLYRGGNALILVDQASDDVIYGPMGTPNFSRIDYFETNPNDAFVFQIWEGLYRLIYRCNVVIDRMPGVPFPSVGATNSAGLPFRDQFIGEAKFLRAFAYFNLVRIFGDVPLHVKEINSIAAINIPRSPVAQVYAQIEADLKDAIEKLPPFYSGSGAGNERGRVTRWAAMTMLTDVYLTLRRFQEARNTASAAITGSAQFGVRLNNAYVDNFAGRGGMDNSPESLFEIQFGGATVAGPGPVGNNFASLMSSGDNTPPGIANYRPSDNSYLENEPGYTGGLIQEYEPGDLRRDVNFYQGRGDGNNIRWLTYKFYRLGPGSGNENYPVYRLADLYLMYAEATNELGGPDAQSVNYLNMIRRRAFGLPLNTPSARDIPANLSQAAFRNVLRTERRRELAMENKRWFDLLRYGFDFMQEVLVNRTKRIRFKREFMLFPIPQPELIANPLLTQNPGY
jgi:hypothetical protein